MFRHHLFQRYMMNFEYGSVSEQLPHSPLSRVGTEDIIYLIHTVMLL